MRCNCIRSFKKSKAELLSASSTTLARAPSKGHRPKPELTPPGCCFGSCCVWVRVPGLFGNLAEARHGIPFSWSPLMVVQQRARLSLSCGDLGSGLLGKSPAMSSTAPTGSRIQQESLGPGRISPRNLHLCCGGSPAATSQHCSCCLSVPGPSTKQPALPAVFCCAPISFQQDSPSQPKGSPHLQPAPTEPSQGICEGRSRGSAQPPAAAAPELQGPSARRKAAVRRHKARAPSAPGEAACH